MNDFYKKSLSELLYESNKNKKLNESLVYTKGIKSLLNESEETNLFKDISEQSINMKNQTDAAALIKAIENLEDFTKSRRALSVHDSNSKILSFIVKHQNKCKVINPHRTSNNIEEVTAGNFAQALLENHSNEILRILVREFYEGPIYDNITAAITSSPSQTQSQTQGSSQDSEAKSLEDLAKNFNPNNASYEDYLDIFEAAAKHNFESEDTKKKLVQKYLKVYSNKIKEEAEKGNKSRLDDALMSKFDSIVKTGLVEYTEIDKIINKINDELAQSNPESSAEQEEKGDPTESSSSRPQMSEEESKKFIENIKKIKTNDLPEVKKIEAELSKKEEPEKLLEDIESKIEKALNIKKEPDFDLNDENWQKTLKNLEEELDSFSSVITSLDHVQPYFKSFEEFQVLLNSAKKQNKVVGDYKTILNRANGLLKTELKRLEANDKFKLQDNNLEIYSGDFNLPNIDEIRKLRASDENAVENLHKDLLNKIELLAQTDITESVKVEIGKTLKRYTDNLMEFNIADQAMDIFKVYFDTIVKVLNRFSVKKVSEVDILKFDEAKFEEVKSLYEKTNKDFNDKKQSFKEKYEELSGKRADFLKKKDDESKDIDNFENVLKNDIDVLFEPFKKLGIEVNFDTIFENKKQKYLSGKLSNFLFEDAPVDPYATSSSSSSLDDEEGGFDASKFSGESFFDDPEDASKVLQQNANKGGLKALMMHLQIVKGIKQQQKEKEVKIPEFVLDLDEIVKKVKIGDAKKVAENITKIFIKEFVALDYSSRTNMLEEELKDMLLSTIERVFSDSSSMFESKIKNKNIISEGAIEGAIGRGFGMLIGSLGGVTGSIVVGELVGNLASKNNFFTDKMGEWPKLKKIIGIKDINTRDFASTLLSSNEYVDMIKKVLQDALKVKILNYFVSIEDGLNKYSVTISMKNAANLRALKRQRKSSVASSKKFGNVTNQGSLFLSEVENSIYTTVMNLPFGNKFTRKSISAISDEFKKSKEFSKLVDAFQKDRLQLDHFVHDRGLSILLEEEDKVGKEIKPIIIDINKMFLEIRDIGKEAIDAKTSFGDFILQKVDRVIDEAEGGKFIFVDDLSGIISRFTRISTKDIKQNLFESSNKRKNMLLEVRPGQNPFASTSFRSEQNEDRLQTAGEGENITVDDTDGGEELYNQELGNRASDSVNPGSSDTDFGGSSIEGEGLKTVKSKTPQTDPASANTPESGVKPQAGGAQAPSDSSEVSSATDSASASGNKPSVEKADYSGYIKWGYFAIRSAYAISKEAKRGRIGKEVIKQKIRSERNIFSDAIAVNIAYHICSFIESRKENLAEFSIKVNGNIEKMAPDRNVETDDRVSQNLLDDIKSNSRFKEFVVSKLPKFLGGGKTTKREVSDDQILNSLRRNLTTVAIGITKLYDKPRYAKIIKASANKQVFDLRRESFVSWYESNNSLDITNILTSEKEINKSEKLLNKEVKKDVDKLALFLLSFSKQVKGIKESKVLHKNKLVDLLFEAPQRIKTNVKDLVKGLRSSGILIYGSGLKPSSREFKEAENHLIGTVADFLYTNFDIEVEGAEQYNKLDPVKVNVERAVNKDAQKGESASEEIAEATSGSGAPLDMNQPASIEQLVSLANMSGGNMMMMFMMMMMNQNFMQMMMQMQKDGASLQDMTEKVAEESDELSDFDKEIAYALKEKRAGLPEIGKREVKRIFKLLNDNPFRKLTYCNDLIFNKELKDQRTFITKIRQYLNVTDKKVANYKEGTVSEAFDFITTSVQKKNYKQENDLRHSKIEYFALYCMLDEVFDVSFVEMQFKDDDGLLKKGNENQTSINQNKLSNYAELDEEGYIISYKQTFYDELEKQVRVTKKEAQRIAEKYLTESSRSYNKPVLRRKIRKSKVISESEFLKNELKRLWKL